ncbi:MAG: histidine kinase [Lachnospiraceae bacterium]|nr:histidine kinase [Lachnospiraceae bacterium]
MRKRWQKLGLYYKFSLTIIMVGLIPMLLLSTYISHSMMQDYRKALEVQYEQATEYVANSIESMLESYNSVSKMPYYYNISSYGSNYTSYMSFDNFRKIVYGEIYAEETMQQRRQSDMENFLQYLGNLDNSIICLHFIAEDLEGEKLDFHKAMDGTYFNNEPLFEQLVGYSELDRSSNKLILIPPHGSTYKNGIDRKVFSVARNYYDLRGNVGNTRYVGTLFFDIDIRRFDRIFMDVRYQDDELFFVTDLEGNCFYSNADGKAGSNVRHEFTDRKKDFVLSKAVGDLGLNVTVVMDMEKAFAKIQQTQKIIYIIIAASICALLGGSAFFSKRLTNPLHEIMTQMEQVGTGNFDIVLPVRSSDEIGVLAGRFNQMSEALKQHINQSYVAQIRQNEAELTALKSQIYPHFLYNTLEVIRMTALDDSEKRVPEMIEALSQQIHYLIGPMQDMVPLEKEIDIVRKYVYLLNCRISGKIQLNMNVQSVSCMTVPKLILQPVVENAYVHGIKPKKGSGCIMIEAYVEDKVLHINVMDNGVGMDEEAVGRLYGIMNGTNPGIKSAYNWQSIGLKNVNDRIKYLYGETYGIEITSTVGIGTNVHIIMPVDG